MTPETAYETTVAIAAPIAEYLGIRNTFNATFETAPAVVRTSDSFSRFSETFQGPCATPRNTKTDAQICTANTGAAPS